MQRTVLSNTAGGADTLFDGVSTHSTSFLSMDIPLKRPVSETLRVKVLNLLQFRSGNGHETAGYFLFWNLWSPISLITIGFILSMKRKDYSTTLLSLAVIARFALIFITAVAPYIMYYLSAYLLSYVLFVFIIANGQMRRA